MENSHEISLKPYTLSYKRPNQYLQMKSLI